jgi:hypothetical protein
MRFAARRLVSALHLLLPVLAGLPLVSVASVAGATGAAVGAAPTVTAVTPLMQPSVNVKALAAPTVAQVHVPVDGDLDPGKTLQSNVMVRPGGSPAPRTPISKQFAPPVRLGPAFACTGSDSCTFNQMPLYNQANPNFAWINSPGWRLPGTATWDASKGIFLMLVDNTAPDRFYGSWMPFGPTPGEAGYIGYWFTALCGPTAESMVLMAALSAKHSYTQVIRGSWMDTSFIHPSIPLGQTVVPVTMSPVPPRPATGNGPSEALDASGQPLTFPAKLKIDHNTLAPNNQQMTGEEIQRVINMALLQGTDPAHGGSFGAIIDYWHHFQYVNPGVPLPAGHLIAQSAFAYWLDAPTLVNLIRQKFAVLIGIQPYVASVTLVGAGTELPHYEMTFTVKDGHALAIEGFTGADSGNPTFIIHDPIYANRITRQLTQIQGGPTLRNGKLMNVTLPGGYNSEATMPYDDAPAVASVNDIQDGQKVMFVNYYAAVSLE